MRILLLLLLAGPCMASGPRYVGSRTDPQVYQEFQNVYHDLANPSDFISAHPFTKAQLLSTIPVKPGQIYYCSDCSTDGLVLSTGTTVGAFGRVSARTTAIN